MDSEENLQAFFDQGMKMIKFNLKKAGRAMNRKGWLIIFWMLLLIYLFYSIFINNGPLWIRILGLVIVIMWGALMPIIDKKKSLQNESR